MNRHTLIVTLAMALLTLLVPLSASAESLGREADDPMQAWLAAMTPGEPHSGLADQAGEWRYVVTIWNEPGAEPMKMTGMSVKTMILGGRYLKEELAGEFMDQPFRGFGLTGYDNVTGEYVATWLDNMGTGIHYYTGREDSKGVRTYTATSHDPATGRPVTTRSVGRVVDRDHHTFESYVKLADGTEQLHMRVEYTRASL